MSKTKAFNVGNYYGNLEIKKEGDKYFWSVENYSGHEWEEIPAYLYEALEKFYNKQNKAEMSGQQIKPCPFCGDPGTLHKDKVMLQRGCNLWAVGCGFSFAKIKPCYGQITNDDDDAFGVSFTSPEAAIEAWNKRAEPTPKFKVGDVVVVTAAMPNFKMTIEHIIERDGKFRYAHRDIYRHENDIELFDPGKKYPFTA